MTVKQLQKLPEKCIGDMEHNEIIDRLFKEVDQTSNNYTRVYNALEQMFETDPRRWNHYQLAKYEVNAINAMMKAKTEETFQKRVYNFVCKQYDKMYGSITERKKIKAFSQLLDDNHQVKTISSELAMKKYGVL